MGFKKELKKELKRLIKSYEGDTKLGEYAKGRLANTKMILDIVKKMNYIPCCETLEQKGSERVVITININTDIDNP